MYDFDLFEILLNNKQAQLFILKKQKFKNIIFNYILIWEYAFKIFKTKFPQNIYNLFNKFNLYMKTITYVLSDSNINYVENKFKQEINDESFKFILMSEKYCVYYNCCKSTLKYINFQLLVKIFSETFSKINY